MLVIVKKGNIPRMREALPKSFSAFRLNAFLYACASDAPLINMLVKRFFLELEKAC